MASIKTGLSITRPLSFAVHRGTTLLAANGTDRPIRWKGTGTAGDAGITAPVSAATAVGSGTGSIAGTYQAYVRYLDVDGLVSDLSPVTTITGTTATATGTITDATNATPIVITSTAHGLSTGNVIRNTNIVGNTAANGVFTITVLTADTFSLNSSVGNGAYTAGGAWVKGVGTISYSAIPVSPEARVTQRQVFRNTSGQLDVFYLDATIANNVDTTASSTKDDDTLSEQTALPIKNPDGTENANVHGVPPTSAFAVAVFQDRSFWLTTANLLYFSEPDLPESVPATSFLPLQSRDQDEDSPVGLMHYRSSLFILQKRHVYSANFAKQPAIDMTFNLACNRGSINDRTWVMAEGAAYLLDNQGIYRFMGGAPEPIDAPIQDYFRDGTVDWSVSKWFFASYEPLTKVVRFHVAFSGDTRPKRALCFSIVTERWWLEVYSVEVGGATVVEISGNLRLLLGGSAGVLLTGEGTQDTSSNVAWSWKSGLLPLAKSEAGLDREVRLVFSPTSGASTIDVALFMNHNGTAETLQGSYALGDGMTLSSGGTTVSVPLKSTRAIDNTTAPTPGFQRALGFSRHVTDESQGDRWLSVKISGEQGADAIKIYGIELVGVG